MNSRQAKLPKEDAGLLAQATDTYRSALQAYRAGQHRRAESAAWAAQVAARGVVHLLQANTPVVEGLPAPPMGPAPATPPPSGRVGTGNQGATMVRDAIREVGAELQDAALVSPRGPGRSFFDAARRALEQARKAAEGGNNRRALQFVMAAEALAHVPEHLRKAEGTSPSAPPGAVPARPPSKGVPVTPPPPSPNRNP